MQSPIQPPPPNPPPPHPPPPPGPHPPRLQGRLQLHRTERRLVPGQRPGRRAGRPLPNYETEVKHLHTGRSVAVDGEVKASPAKGQATEVHATSVEMARRGRRRDVPAPEEGAHVRVPPHHRPPAAADQHLRRRRPRVRNQVSPSIHDFFQEQGFLYIHTPIITASDCEGRRAMFRVTTLDPAKPRRRPRARSTHRRTSSASPAFLTVSGQLQAEIFACSLGKVYTFGPTFRAENSNTPRHLAEFWMVEPEMAFYDLTDNMDLAEAFLKRIIATCSSTAPRT